MTKPKLQIPWNNSWAALLIVAVAIAFLALAASGLAYFGGPAGEEPVARSYNTAVYTEQGGAKLVIASGGELEVRSGGTLDLQSGATSLAGAGLDLNGTELTLDADADTSLTADTDDQIDIEINGADDFQFTANTFTVISGSKILPQNATNTGAGFSCYNTLAHTNTTNKTMCVVPAGANLVDATLVVVTAFDDSGTDVINCGTTSGDPDEFVDALDASAAGINRAGDAADMPIVPGTGELPGDVGVNTITVLCKYTGQNANAAAGSAIFILNYILD